MRNLLIFRICSTQQLFFESPLVFSHKDAPNRAVLVLSFWPLIWVDFPSPPNSANDHAIFQPVSLRVGVKSGYRTRFAFYFFRELFRNRSHSSHVWSRPRRKVYELNTTIGPCPTVWVKKMDHRLFGYLRVATVPHFPLTNKFLRGRDRYSGSIRQVMRLRQVVNRFGGYVWRQNVSWTSHKLYRVQVWRLGWPEKSFFSFL